MALTADRATKRRGNSFSGHPVAETQDIKGGALVMRDADGYAVKGITAAALVALGIARKGVDNSAGSNGDETVEVDHGPAYLENSAGADAITRADIGKYAYVVDDAKVAKTSANGARSPAGKILDVDDFGVLVDINPLGVNAEPYVLQRTFSTLKGATAQVRRVIVPFTGRIRKIESVIEGTLSTGNATITASINGVAVTNGVITVTQAGSAAGDKDSASPTAANEVAAGDVIELTAGGLNASDTEAEVFITIER